MPRDATGGAAQAAWKTTRAEKADALLATLYRKRWRDDDIAHALGVGFNTVYRWRRGTATPQGRHLDALKSLVEQVKAGKISKPKRLVA